MNGYVSTEGLNQDGNLACALHVLVVHASWARTVVQGVVRTLRTGNSIVREMRSHPNVKLRCPVRAPHIMHSIAKGLLSKRTILKEKRASLPLAKGPRPAGTTLGLPMPANRLPRPMVEERDTPSGDGREPMIERKDLLRRKGDPTVSARLRLRNDRPTQYSLTHAFKMPEI